MANSLKLDALANLVNSFSNSERLLIYSFNIINHSTDFVDSAETGYHVIEVTDSNNLIYGDTHEIIKTDGLLQFTLPKTTHGVFFDAAFNYEGEAGTKYMQAVLQYGTDYASERILSQVSTGVPNRGQMQLVGGYTSLTALNATLGHRISFKSYAGTKYISANILLACFV